MEPLDDIDDWGHSKKKWEANVRFLRRCATDGAFLLRQVKHLRECTSRGKWRFRRGCARLLYRPVVQALGAKYPGDV